MDKSKTYFPALTGLRALAAYMVFFDHFPPLTKSYSGWIMFAFFHEFYIGVSIFFVLSGFLIAIRYFDFASTEKKWLYNYFKNRFARIYPMYFLITIITFAYYWHFPNKDVINHNPLYVFIANITLTKGFFDQIKTTGISQGWTLTVEECFYALAPAIFLLSSKIKFRYQVLFFYLTGLALVDIFSNINFYGLFDTVNFMFIATFFGRCLEFYIGIQLALWYKKGYRIRFPKKNYTVLGMLSILVTLILLVLCRGKCIERGFYTLPGSLINNFLLPFGIGILLWGLIFEKTWLSKLLETKLFSLLGKSSYTFYLIHLGILSEVLFKYVTHNYLLSFPVAIIVSIVLYKLIEEPFNKLIKAKF
jgi:peptidoglycan/LPS O-acetylase OafA/YrhL